MTHQTLKNHLRPPMLVLLAIIKTKWYYLIAGTVYICVYQAILLKDKLQCIVYFFNILQDTVRNVRNLLTLPQTIHQMMVKDNNSCPSRLLPGVDLKPQGSCIPLYVERHWKDIENKAI